MNKEKAVAVMVEFINNQNRMVAAMNGAQSGVSLSDIEAQIQSMQPNLNQLCSGLYDEMAKKSIIPIF